VAATLPNFTLCSQLDAIIRKFLWGFKDSKQYNLINSSYLV